MIAARGNTEAAQRALGELCKGYWFPLYAYARRRGLPAEDAEDVTQEFFHTIISREVFARIVPERGKLRAFMLGAMKNVITDGHRRQSAQRRGGGEAVFSIDVAYGEKCLAGEPSHGQSPDVLFDRSWAYALLESARRRLGDWYAGMGKQELWQTMRPFLSGTGREETLRATAQQLGVNETALRSAVHQMRKRYRGLIEEEVRQTVAGETEAQEELIYLRQVLAAD